MPRAGRLPLLALACVIAAGCGGGKSAGTIARPTTAPPPAAAPPDPGRDTIGAFVAAAGKGRLDVMWRLLSTSSRGRLGPTLAGFRTGAGAKLTERVGSFGSFRLIVSERVTPEFGVVAIDGPRLVQGSRKRDVYAAVLRLEGTEWKLELGGPVVVRPIGPDPGAREPLVAQVAGAVEGPGGAGTAVMYLDGQAVTNPTVAGSASTSTVFANFEPALDPGRHTVVLFASDGREASAVAWAFASLKGP